MTPETRQPLPRSILRTSLITLAGGLLFSSISYLAGQGYLALGFFLGAFLSPLVLFSLRSLSVKVLSAGQAGAGSTFWSRHFLRWVLFALIGLVLVRISIFCLLGALGSYTWFLSVLAWEGWRQGRQLTK